MKVEVNIDELLVGHYVVEIASQKGSFTLSKASHIKSKGVIQNLKANGVSAVFIDPKKTLSAQSKKPKKQFSSSDYSEAKEIFSQAKTIQKKVFEDALNECDIDLKPVNEITQQTIDKTMNSPSSLACAINIRKKDEYLLEHSVAVSVLMCIFCQHLNVDKETTHHLVVGAFLHDVGKIKIPDKVLNKPGRLTESEFDIMKTHASHSIDIIKETPGISELSIEVASLHHEKINGLGYPNQKKGDDITQYGRMIAICDIFDALTAHRCYKKGFTHLKAFSILKELANDNHLDRSLVDEFIRCIGAFPIGSIVQLESNKLAIVEGRNNHDPMNPKVRSFYSAKHNHFLNIHDIDLSKSDDKIVKAVRADDFDLDLNKITEMLIREG